jgi:hypothetical protein
MIKLLECSLYIMLLAGVFLFAFASKSSDVRAEPCPIGRSTVCYEVNCPGTCCCGNIWQMCAAGDYVEQFNLPKCALNCDERCGVQFLCCAHELGNCGDCAQGCGLGTCCGLICRLGAGSNHPCKQS